MRIRKSEWNLCTHSCKYILGVRKIVSFCTVIIDLSGPLCNRGHRILFLRWCTTVSWPSIIIKFFCSLTGKLFLPLKYQQTLELQGWIFPAHYTSNYDQVCYGLLVLLLTLQVFCLQIIPDLQMLLVPRNRVVTYISELVSRKNCQ